MEEMAKKSAGGNLSPFSGMFSAIELNESEKGILEAILHKYAPADHHFSADLKTLTAVTSEVKSINCQSALLHGERIKKAQNILKAYRDGAFTTWLIATYGNRQTPYNFLQYYEFYAAMPKTLRPQIDVMPRQAVYTLASREGSLEKKQEIVENYNGETKAEILYQIREAFPLATEDRRKENIQEGVMKSLVRLITLVSSRRSRLSNKQKQAIFERLDQLYDLIEKCKAR